MPELPEVESIVRKIRPELVGKSIVKANLLWERTLATPSPKEFKTRIAGQKIELVSRRGKFIHVLLDPYHLFVHLRMSGDLYIREGNAAIEKHDRLILILAPGPFHVDHLHKPDKPGGKKGAQELVFNDTRKFGRVWLVNEPDEVTGGLGPEPLSAEFSPQWLYQALQSRHRQLKPLLLDQTFLAGMGNIYVDEALHIAQLHPLATSDSVNRGQATRLQEAIQHVLQEGIRRNGASIDWVYRGGEFQNYFRVYDRKGKPCPACGTGIQRIVVGQRGTHICPNCQRI